MKLFSFICKLRGYHASLFVQSGVYSGAGDDTTIGGIVLSAETTIGTAYPCSMCGCSLSKLDVVVQIVNYVKWESK